MNSRGPLIVRLCNWVGEVVLSLPTLHMLAAQGYELHLIGKRWAGPLLEGEQWPVHVRPGKRMAAIAQLRSLRAELSRSHPRFARQPNYLLLTSSFSSALEGRLAGLNPVGYRLDGRGWLLAHGVPYIGGLHAADNYWRIGTHLAGVEQVRPPHVSLQPSSSQKALATQLLSQHGLAHHGFAILCPFSGADDTTGKKHWPPFPELAQRLHEDGITTVLCPGPGEEMSARAHYPWSIVLDGLDLGTYAALTSHAGCTVSNDTGPGHLAAAAGARLISVLGPDGADMWLAQGQHVVILRPAQGWPSLQDVLDATRRQMCE